MTENNSKSRLMLISAMFIFGTIGIFRRYIPLSSSMLAMARGFIGMAFLLVLVRAKGKKLSFEAIKENLIVLLVSGALIGFNWILLFEAYNYTSVATATLCYYMAPIIVILVSPILLKETLTLKKMICVAVALFGMVLVSGVIGAEFNGVSEFKGVLLGLGAAVFYASVVLLNQKIHDISAYDKTIVQLFAAAVVLVPYTMLTENFAELIFTPFVIFMIAFVGIVHTGIAYAVYFGSMDNLSAQTVALFSYIDPIVAIILSAVLLKEGMDIPEIIGAVLVLCATMVSEMPEKVKEAK